MNSSLKNVYSIICLPNSNNPPPPPPPIQLSELVNFFEIWQPVGKTVILVLTQHYHTDSKVLYKVIWTNILYFKVLLSPSFKASSFRFLKVLQVKGKNMDSRTRSYSFSGLFFLSFSLFHLIDMGIRQ